MGQGQSQRQNDYVIEENDDEPVIIREVKPVEKPRHAEHEVPVLFKWTTPVNDIPAGVFVGGTFNKWTKHPMKRVDGEYVESIDMVPGDYEYKFFVDGEWQHDPTLPHKPNKFGSYNNEMKVTQFDSLDCETCIESGESSARTLNFSELGEDNDKYSDDGFSSEIPDMTVYSNAGPPPQLPVQLSRGILNSETDQTTDPTLLPEPQHVLLNHLYALTLREGVIVLGATHRYKRKYVTTMLYKPITKSEQ